MHDFITLYYFVLKSKEIDTLLPYVEPVFPKFLEEGTYTEVWNMKTIFPQSVLLRKHMQVHVLKTIKNTLQFLLIEGGRIKMKIRKEKMKQFISTIHK